MLQDTAKKFSRIAASWNFVQRYLDYLTMFMYGIPIFLNFIEWNFIVLITQMHLAFYACMFIRLKKI